MSIIRSNAMEYVESGIEGISQCELWNNGTNGGTSIVHLLKDAYFPNHSHPGWEQAYVLSGKIVVGKDVAEKGDYLFANTGDIHDAKAMEDTDILVFTEKGVELI